jgi:hypothetical protein
MRADAGDRNDVLDEYSAIVPSCLAAEGAGPPPVIPVSPTRSWAAWWNLVLSLPWARVADRPVE